MCSFEQSPGIIFASTTDETETLPGLVCQRVDGPLPGGSFTSWATFWKLVKLIGSA